MVRLNFFISFTLLLCLSLSGLVLGLHISTNSFDGSSSFGTGNEDISFLFNLTVNNTDSVSSANITQVNITLPASFAYTSGSSGASLMAYTLSESSTLVSFTNYSGLIMNSNAHSFWFNASASTPGHYNITILTVNASGVTSTNLTVRINDTTAPASLSFNSPGYTSSLNLSRNSIAVNVSASDNSALGAIQILIYNAGYASLINSSTGSYGSSSHFFNFTLLSDGIFFVNVSVNDTSDNSNTTLTPLRIALDTVAPSVDLDDVFSNRTALNISISISDATTGVSGVCSIVSGGGSITGTGSTQYLFRNGLDCGDDFTFEVSCSDYASNVGSRSETFSTDGCASSGGSTGSSGGSGTGGTSTGSYWKRTVGVNSEELGEGYSTILKIRERFRVEIENSDYYVGIVDIDPTDITFNISSTNFRDTLNINESQRLELTNDAYYDLLITLHDINSSGTGANISLYSLHELTSSELSASLSTNSSSDSSASLEAIGSLFSKNAWWLWIIIALVLVVIVLGAWKFYDKRQRLKGVKSELN